jgi:hypothetical protein
MIMDSMIYTIHPHPHIRLFSSVCEVSQEDQAQDSHLLSTFWPRAFQISHHMTANGQRQSFVVFLCQSSFKQIFYSRKLK